MELAFNIRRSYLVTPLRTILFKHMFAEHNFNIGLPDNLVNVNEFLDMLEAKLTRYVALSDSRLVQKAVIG